MLKPPRPSAPASCIEDSEVLKLADHAIRIEEHYSRRAGHAEPMDIEWAKDADDGELYIVQARPETVTSQRSTSFFETYTLTGSGTRPCPARPVGEKIGTGIVRVSTAPRIYIASNPRGSGCEFDESRLGTCDEDCWCHRY